MFTSARAIFLVSSRNYSSLRKLKNKTFVRLLLTRTENNNLLIPISLKSDFTCENDSSKVLEKLLIIRPFIAKDIIMKYNKFHKIPSNSIKQNFQACVEVGILIETLRKYPEVLAEFDISIKIPELKQLPLDINVTTPLLSVPYRSLKRFILTEINASRISLISNLLNMEESEVCKSLASKRFLLSLDLNQLTSNIKLLTENGISKDQIVNDLWVLRYSLNTIKERLDLAKENNVDYLKTWMVRAQPDIFERYIKRRSDKKLILGGSSVTQYLSERLECAEDVAKYIISKHPALQNKSLKKMNEIIDFLFKYGFKPIHICRVPKILLHSVETTRKRLKELEAIGMYLDSLYILTKSQRQYMQYYESLIKTNKSKSRNT